jgi:predicted nucleic acid-binding Zn ribbon protein
VVSYHKEIKCPICGELHPAGSKFCSITGGEIKQPNKTKLFFIIVLVIACIFIVGVFVLFQNKKLGIVGITVNIVPEVDGAKWKIYNVSSWKKSGDTHNVETGHEYKIVFKSITGWVTPDNEVFIPQSNKPIYINSAYRREKIQISVRLEPVDVRDKAKWKVHNVSTWRRSSESVRVEIGKKYKILYNNVDGWVTPHYKNVDCQLYNDLSLKAYYVKSQDEGLAPTVKQTSITVSIEPFDARNAGAKWKIDPWDWQDSGDTIELMIPATYSVRFKNDIPGWLEPGKIDVSIKKGQNKKIVRRYVKQ